MPRTRTGNLPDGARSRLEYIATATGEISEGDIAAFDAAYPGMMPEKVSAAVALLNRIDALCADSMLDPDETMQSDQEAMDAVRALAEIVKPIEKD